MAMRSRCPVDRPIRHGPRSICVSVPNRRHVRSASTMIKCAELAACWREYLKIGPHLSLSDKSTGSEFLRILKIEDTTASFRCGGYRVLGVERDCGVKTRIRVSKYGFVSLFAIGSQRQHR